MKSGEPVFDGSPDAQKAQSSQGRWRRSGQKRTKVAVASSARLAWPNFAGVGKIRLEGENGDGKAWKRGSQQMRQESARQLPTEWKMKRSDLKLDRTECRIAAAAGSGRKGSSCPNLVMKGRKGRPSSSCTTKKGVEIGRRRLRRPNPAGWMETACVRALAAQIGRRRRDRTAEKGRASPSRSGLKGRAFPSRTDVKGRAFPSRS